MDITFSSESGRPGFILKPRSDDDYAILKLLVDWKQNFPEDTFGVKSSSWSDGKCLNASIGYLKPYKANPPTDHIITEEEKKFVDQVPVNTKDINRRFNHG